MELDYEAVCLHLKAYPPGGFTEEFYKYNQHHLWTVIKKHPNHMMKILAMQVIQRFSLKSSSNCPK